MSTDVPPAAPPAPTPPKTWVRILAPVGVVFAGFVIGGILFAYLDAAGVSERTAETVAGFVATSSILGLGYVFYRALRPHERRQVLPSRGSFWISVLIGLGLGLAARIVVGLIVQIGESLDNGVCPALKDAADQLAPDDLATWHKILLFVAVVALAPLGEELVFRGLFLRGLIRTMPFLPAAAISGVVFAAFHQQYWRAWPILVGFTAFGVAAAYVYRWRGLPANVTMHAVFNVFAAVFLFSDFGLDTELTCD